MFGETEDLTFLPTVTLARLLRERRVSSREMVETLLKRIETYNPTYNAVVTVDAERALRMARAADEALARGETWGPLHGVPVTIKDVFETAGLRTTASYPPLARYVPSRDATVVARLRAAGAILLGKTNTPMLAMDFQTRSPVFGLTRNPWAPDRTVGGSTGGGAAAVAAGLSPLDIGSDIGGSIRIPAHFCGIYGFKPSEGLVSTAGHIPELPGRPRGIRHMLVAGPLARSVADLRLALLILAGPDGRHWEVPPVPVEPVPGPDLRTCRIAWTDEYPEAPVSADTRSALENLADALARAGARVERTRPADLDLRTAWETWGLIAGAEIGSTTPTFLRYLLRVQFRLWAGGSPMIRAAVRGAGLRMTLYAKALTRRDRLIGILERFLADWDAWILPVALRPAFPHWKTGRPIPVDGRRVPYWIVGIGYTCIFNLTGHPVVVVPVGRSSEGLPIGVQVVGRRWEDLRLLGIAERIAEVVGPLPTPKPGEAATGKSAGKASK
jgi:amidase